MVRRIELAALSIVALLAGTGLALADDSWNPFKEREQRSRGERQARPEPLEPTQQPLPPMDGISSRPWASPGRDGPSALERSDAAPPLPEVYRPWAGTPAEAGRAPGAAASTDTVQRGKLAPAVASDGTGLPHAFWQGVDAARLQEMMAQLTIPPRSAAMAELWRRLWSADLQAAAGGAGAPPFAAIRLEALYRSGHLEELLRAAQSTATGGSTDPASALLSARTRVTLGDREAGCAEVKGLQRAQSGLPRPMRHEFLQLAALCGAAGRDAGAAGLAADLLRSESVDAPLVLAALDALAAGGTGGDTKLPAARRAGLLDHRFLELAEIDRLSALLPVADPALLASLATSAREPATRILAAEAAAAANIIQPAALAAAWRSAPASAEAATDTAVDRLPPPLRRAALFRAVEAERTPMRKTRLVRSLLDEVRRARGPYTQAAAAVAPLLGDLRPVQEIGWFAETAIEISLAAGRYDAVRAWVEPPLGERYGGLGHWLVLADIADPRWPGRRGDALAAAEQFAIRGRLAPELMHRLVTVLDALDYQIPIPLWEAASRSPQPATGHLPDTGVLTQLKEAAGRKEHARTVLLALRTLGPDSGETAHMIALGDVIRALRRAGLEPDARRLGLEALFLAWPRSANN